MVPFGRSYVYVVGDELHEVEFTFNGDEFIARCSCQNCRAGRMCRHIGQFLSEPPMSEAVLKYPLKIERLKKV